MTEIYDAKLAEKDEMIATITAQKDEVLAEMDVEIAHLKATLVLQGN